MMNNRKNRILSILCAAMMTACAAAIPALAEEDAATPTDLKPEQKQEEPQAGEEPVGGEEIVITKAMGIGESWEGKVSTNKPAILKLDVTRAQTVFAIVEGKGTRTTVQKADKPEDHPRKDVTDPATNRSIVTWDAEACSYLITLEPDEGRMMSRVKVTVLDENAYEAWETEQENQPLPEPGSEETEPTPPETEPTEENIPESKTETPRSIDVNVTWDSPDPVIGDTAHFKATLNGYEELTYTLQWQYSPDRENWFDLPGETELTMDVVVTEENNIVYWRILVYVEDDVEQEA